MSKLILYSLWQKRDCMCPIVRVWERDLVGVRNGIALFYTHTLVRSSLYQLTKIRVSRRTRKSRMSRIILRSRKLLKTTVAEWRRKLVGVAKGLSTVSMMAP